MSKKIKFLVLIMLVILFVIKFETVSYGISERLDYVIAQWNTCEAWENEGKDFKFTSSEATDDNMKKWNTFLLEKLQKIFSYEGSTIKKTMAMKTKIYITNEDGEKCTIRIRKRRSSRN